MHQQYRTDRKPGSLISRLGALLFALVGLHSIAYAQTTPEAKVGSGAGNAERKVHFVYLGGNDCPPCEAWRGTDLVQLKKTDIFKQITFSYVNKTIRSPIPPTFFLPPEVKPLKEKLDVASGYNIGSPHFALLLNDQVVDYWFNTFDVSAEQLEKMLSALKQGSEYPRKPCSKYRPKTRVCEA
jgi:hypothetical protein